MSNKDNIKNNFSKSAIDYNEFAQIQLQVANSLAKFSLEYIKDNDLILDVGSGTGFMIDEILANKNAIGIASDISMEMLAQQKTISNKSCINCDFDNLTFDDEYFDVIVSSFSLHWSLNFKKTILEICRVCKKSGYFIFAIPLSNSLHELRKLNIETINEFYDQGFVKNMINENGFSLIDYKIYNISQSFDNAFLALRNIKKVGAQSSLMNKKDKNNLYNLKHINKFNLTWEIGFFAFKK